MLKQCSLLIYVMLCIFSCAQSQKQKQMFGLTYGLSGYRDALFVGVDEPLMSVKQMRVYSVGIQQSGNFLSRSSNLDAAILFDYFYPQVIAPESILKLRGYKFGLLIGDNLLKRSKNFDFLALAGITTGSMRVSSVNVAGGKNPFTCLALMIQPGIHMGGLGIALRVGYEWDVSHAEWRSVEGSPSAKPLNWNQTNWNVKLVLGMSIKG